MKIQRKLKRKSKNRKTHVKQSQNELINPAEIPPHLLDKIPPGLSLKPNAATIRQIAMQQMTRNMLPLNYNLTPQQQQVQNMKSNNDLKENAINQAKQDMINEHERKRALQRQEADAKRENQQRKHDIENERRRVDNELKEKEQAHKLDQDEKKLNYERDLLNDENELNKKRLKNEEQLALIHQARYEQQKLKLEQEGNYLDNKFKLHESELTDLRTQNEAMRNALNKVNTEEYMNEFNDLINNLAAANAENRILNLINEQQNKLTTERLLSKIEPKQEQIDELFNAHKDQIEGLQSALAEQLKNKQTKQDEKERLENLHKFKQKLVIDNDNLKHDLYEINERVKRSKVDDGKLKKSISEKVKNEVLLNAEKQVYEQQQESERLTRELITQQEKMKIINNKEYKDKQKALAALIESNEQKKKDIAFINDSVKALTDADSLLFESQIKGVVRNAIHDDKNVLDALKGLYDTKLDPQSLLALSEQRAAQLQLINQEDEDKYKYVNEFQKIKDSGIHKIQDYFVEFTKQTNSDPDYFMTWLNNDASGADVKEFWNQYQQFLAQKEKEEKAQKENEENEENEQNDEDFLA